MGVFSFILISVIVINIIGLTQFGLGWDNSADMKNPIVNTMSLMNLRAMIIDASSL